MKPVLRAVLVATLAVRGVAAQVRTVAPADLSKLSPSDFRDDELDLPYYLANFHRLANSVALSGDRRGFIDIQVWRSPQDNQPHNARIMENILSLVYFYTTDRPWNVYHGDPALRARLEAALDFWARSQSEDGQFSEYAPRRWSLAPTAFATKFMGEGLRLLRNGPPIDSAIHRRAIEADRRAIVAVLTREDLYEHGRRFSNQFGNVWGGALAYLALYPDAEIAGKLRARLKQAATDQQSPVGYFYEAYGPDWGYDLNTHHSDLQMAWHYARGGDLAGELVDATRRWYDWFAYNAVPEPGSVAFTLNRSIETRQKRAVVAEAGPGESVPGTPLAELVPAARVLGPTREELVRRTTQRRADLVRRWPAVDSLTLGAFSTFSPYAFLHREHVQWHPSDRERADAVAAMRHQRETRFTHQRADSRKPMVFTYVRRPAYYAAFTGGATTTPQQRYGLGLLWLPGAGTVLQSQTAGTTTAWGTRAADTSIVYEAASFDPTFHSGATPVTPQFGAHDLPNDKLSIAYPLGKRGEKRVTFTDSSVRVEVTHTAPFVEQLPLLLLASDSLATGKGTATLRRGVAQAIVRWSPASVPVVQRTEERSGDRRVVALSFPGSGSLTYEITFATAPRQPARNDARELIAFERARVLTAAKRALAEPPVTVTATRSERSAGGLHDFFSEGDYWWPDPKDPNAPYIQRDGETNPDNFVAHRDAMRRLSQIVPALVAAYRITSDVRYARAAERHLNAWFVAESTRMTPNLLYAQAIKGRFTGRGIGIIDTIHLVEVAQAAAVLERMGYLKGKELAALKQWFRDYLEWMTTHEYGLKERDNGNNHSAAWALQVAAFSRFAGDTARLDEMRRFFTETLIPRQMAPDGSFPRELARTKPYGYSLFQLDVMGMLAEELSTPAKSYWTFTTPDGRGMARALAYMYPYIADKQSWPKPPDVQYHEQWPVRHPALYFGGRALDEPRYIALWKTLDADPTVDEIVRNYPVRQPVLWVP